MNLLWGLLIGLGLVAANGFFVAVEFALLSARRSRIETAAKNGRFGANAALAGMRSLNLQLAASQLGITIMSLLLGWLVEPLLSGVFESLLGRTALPEQVSAAVGLGIGLVIVALVHMVLGEMVPKSLALAEPERAVMLLAPIHRVVAMVVRPVVVALYSVARAGTRLLGVDPTDELVEAHTVQELAVILDASHIGGLLDTPERDRLVGAIGFLRLTAADVMKPRDELTTVNVNATAADVESAMFESGHSRVLVEDAAGSVLGFFHVKDVLNIAGAGRSAPIDSKWIHEAIEVGSSESLVDLLLKARSARRNLAMVVGERTAGVAGVVGLVSVEDVVEAIFGDITDETDVIAPTPRRPLGAQLGDEGNDNG